MDAQWIIATAAALTLVGALIGVMWKFSKSVDRNTIITQQILETQKSQWTRIDEHGIKIDEHGERLVKIETRLDYTQRAPV